MPAAARFRLRTFGGLALVDPVGGAATVAIQRKRLVLLAVLAASGPAGMARDRVLAYLWPDSDDERARQSLKQAMYALRRDVGEDAVGLGPTEIRLDESVLSSDVGEFRAALAAQDFERAVDLHVGPFLDGVHVQGTPELERWIEQERRRQAVAYADALEKLARRAAGVSPADAVLWWRRLVASDPASSRATLELMRALAAAGDAPAALRQARLHETVVRQEFDAPPDAAVVALADRIRRTPPATPSVPPAPPVYVPPAATSPSMLEERPPAPLPSATALPAPVRKAAPARWLGRAAVAVLALLAVGTVVLRGRSERVVALLPDAAQDLVVVLPFEVRGAPDLAYLSEGLVDLLASNLHGAGDVRSVDPRATLDFVGHAGDHSTPLALGQAAARRFGARRFLLGTVTAAGEDLLVSATLFDQRHPEQAPIRVAVRGAAADVFTLVDSVTVRVLSSLSPGPSARLARAGASTTRSVPALKAYLRGEAEYRRARYDAAVAALQEAVAHDSGFALAHYRLSRAADWAGQIDLARAASERARRTGGGLGAHERMLLDGLAAQRRGDTDEAERIYRDVVNDYPTDVEAWFQLGEVLFHENGPRGRSFVEARPAFERLLVLTPDDAEGVLHLARIAAAEGDQRRLDSLRRTPSGRTWPELGVLHAFVGVDAGEQASVLATLRAAPDLAVHDHCWRVAVFARRTDNAARICGLLTDAHRPPEFRALGHQRLSELALAEGRLRDARRHLTELGRILPEWGATLAAFHAAVPLAPTSPARLWAARDRLARTSLARVPDRADLHFAVFNGEHESVRRYVLDHLTAQLGAPPRSSTTPSPLRGDSATRSARLRRNLEASAASYAFAAVSDAAGALARLDQVRGDRHSGELWYGAIAYDRFLRATLLRQLGRPAEALRWYRSFGEPQVFDLVYAGQGAFMSAVLSEELRRPREAVEHYARFVALWQRSDPEFRPLVDLARRRLHALSRPDSAPAPADD